MSEGNLPALTEPVFDLGEPVLYKGEPVCTLAQMAQFFADGGVRTLEQVRGAINTNFQRNRGDMDEGNQFFTVPYEEWSKLQIYPEYISSGEPGGYRGSMIFLTESGFLYLSMLFRGKKAAKIRQHILYHYFRSKSLQAALVPANLASEITKGLMPVLNGLVDHGSHVDKRLDQIDNRVGQIEITTKEVLHLVGRRKHIKAANRRIYASVIERYYARNCPNCGKTPVIDEFGNEITKEFEADHWTSPTQNGLKACWAICHTCNQGFWRNINLRTSARPYFESFQSRVDQWIEEENGSGKQLEFFQ